MEIDRYLSMVYDRIERDYARACYDFLIGIRSVEPLEDRYPIRTAAKQRVKRKVEKIVKQYNKELKGEIRMKIEQRWNLGDNTIDLVIKGARPSKDFTLATFYPLPWYSKADRGIVINAIVPVLEDLYNKKEAGK